MTQALRRRLLFVFVIGCAGTGAELLLTSHTGDFWQKTPIALLAAGIPVAALAAFSRAPWPRTMLQVLSVLFMLAGMLGTFFHYESNSEFARELTPGLSGWALLSESMTRPTPPPLAPGTMIVLGLLGVVAAGKGEQ